MDQKTEWIIGRAPACDIVVSEAGVSQRHCRLRRVQGTFLLEDLGSSNGTFVNNRLLTEPTGVSSSDRITLGLTAVFAWPEKLRQMEAPQFSRPAPKPTEGVYTSVFQGTRMVLGRDPACDRVLDFPMVSRRHAVLTRRSNVFFVEDLGSSNGTFLNHVRIDEIRPVRPGDVIALGSYQLTLTPHGELEQLDLRGRISLEARDITVDVPNKRLLERVSLTINPGEFVGLMGPSGAGKTTLMSALNGYLRPSAGDVLLNGERLYGSYGQFASSIGYVPQDDIMHRDLTVREALYYTARLRLPSDYTEKDIDSRIAVVLADLGLSAISTVRIGTAERGIISGGQRKRVNLAMELLTDPLILFLDEPTSGLSSEDALMVMKVLRSLAKAGKSILLTIHQPSLDVYKLLDSLVIVSKDAGSAEAGRLVYFGPAYPDAVSFFNPEQQWPEGASPSPDEILRGHDKKRSADWLARYETSEHYRSFVAGRAGNVTPITRTTQTARNNTPQGMLLRTFTLVRRSVAIKRRDTWNTCILLAQAPIVAVLIALLFGPRTSQSQSTLRSAAEVAGTMPIAIFVLVLAALWFGCSNAVREIVGEWIVYRRERMVNLKLPEYVASKMAVMGGLCIVQCLVLLLVVYPGCGMKGNPLLLACSLTAVSWVGVGIGLCLSAAAKTTEAAIALLPILLLPMVMLGGCMIAVNEMPPYMQPLAQMMPSRWAFESILVSESDAHPRHDVMPEQKTSQSPAKGGEEITSQPIQRPDMADSHFPRRGDHRLGSGVGIAVLALMFGTLYAAVHVILRFRDLH